jgi:hypothetical protein
LTVVPNASVEVLASPDAVEALSLYVRAGFTPRVSGRTLVRPAPAGTGSI